MTLQGREMINWVDGIYGYNGITLIGRYYVRQRESINDWFAEYYSNADEWKILLEYGTQEKCKTICVDHYRDIIVNEYCRITGEMI